jgi:hypothetical protein
MLVVWVGHSCPTPLTLILILSFDFDSDQEGHGFSRAAERSFERAARLQAAP